MNAAETEPLTDKELSSLGPREPAWMRNIYDKVVEYKDRIAARLNIREPSFMSYFWRAKEMVNNYFNELDGESYLNAINERQDD